MEFLKRDTQFDFLGKRRLAGMISLALIALGIASLLVRGLNFGIDFSGGTLVEVSYKDSVTVEKVREQLKSARFDDARVQYFGTSRDILVRLPARSVDNNAAISSDIMETLRLPFLETLAESPQGGLQQCVSELGLGECSVQMRRVEFVGPQVGGELTEKGGLAMIYALIGILIYVAWRFEWRFALGAVAALVHDVLITISFFSLFGLEFSLPVLAALLAVIAPPDATGALDAGMLLNRSWSFLNGQHIAAHPYYVISDQLARLSTGTVPSDLVGAATTLANNCQNTLGLSEGESLHMLLRVGYPKKQTPPSSLRLPIEKVFTDTSTR